MEIRKVFSATELDRLTGLTPPVRRTLNQTGVLNPARTGAGHAIYGEDDVVRGRAYVQQQRDRLAGRTSAIKKR